MSDSDSLRLPSQQGQRTQEEWQTIINAFTVDEHNGLPPRAGGVPRLSFSPDSTDESPDLIDHTLLKLDAERTQIDSLCEEARTYGFKSVCVRLSWVRRCEENLRGSNVVIACVVGFHEGTYATSEKVKEALEAVTAGAKELDMVLNYVELKDHHFAMVFEDIAKVRQAVPQDVTLKVILETSQLTRQDIVNGCLIADEAGADFIKTSTGFNGEGAKLEDIELMKETIFSTAVWRAQMKAGARSSSMKIKASGGIRDFKTAKEMVSAGASRLGTSSGVKIIEEWKEQKRVAEEKDAARSYDGFESEKHIGSRHTEPRSLNLEGPPSL